MIRREFFCLYRADRDGIIQECTSTRNKALSVMALPCLIKNSIFCARLKDGYSIFYIQRDEPFPDTILSLFFCAEMEGCGEEPWGQSNPPDYVAIQVSAWMMGWHRLLRTRGVWIFGWVHCIVEGFVFPVFGDGISWRHVSAFEEVVWWRADSCHSSYVVESRIFSSLAKAIGFPWYIAGNKKRRGKNIRFKCRRNKRIPVSMLNLFLKFLGCGELYLRNLT
jgi:hypothetical protein